MAYSYFIVDKEIIDMYILTNEKPCNSNAFQDFLPPSIRAVTMSIEAQSLEEIRLRRQKPLSVCMNNGNYFIDKRLGLTKKSSNPYIVTNNDMDIALELISQGSLYSFENEISQGFITISGGHRIGLVGKAVLKGSDIKYIKDISGLNYRFAKQILGAADIVMPSVCISGTPQNTLIISPPQCGKTTILRDISRQISEMGYKVCVIDERCEIAGMVDGVSSYDIGLNTDVFDSCPKAEGMLLALRSMSPQVLITDEIGSNADIEALNTALSCGVSVVASIHASNRADLIHKPNFAAICNLFDIIITLSKRNGSGTIEEVYPRP